MTPVAPTLGLAWPRASRRRTARRGRHRCRPARRARGAGRTHLPDDLADIEPGEAVLVEYARRQALASSSVDAPAARRDPKPIVDRVRADGPLLPPLTLPSPTGSPITTSRRRRCRPGDAPARPPRAARARRRANAGRADGDRRRRRSRPPGPAGRRAAAGPRPRRAPRAGPVSSVGSARSRPRARDPRLALLAAGAGPRYERWVRRRLRRSRASIAAGGQPAGRPLGPRSSRSSTSCAGRARGRACAGRGPRRRAPRSSALAGLVRRGLAASMSASARAGRSPRARRPARRPAADVRPHPAAGRGGRRGPGGDRAGDPTPILLDGVTGGGKTAIYVEAIAASLARGRPALVLVPEIALAMPLVDRLRADLARRVALVHSRPGRRGAGRRMAADPGGRRGHRGRDAAGGPRAARRCRARHRRRGARGTYKSDRTPRLQARDTAIRLAELAGARGRPRQRHAGRRQRRSGRVGRRTVASCCRPPERRAADGRGRRPPGGARRRQPRACCRTGSSARSRALDPAAGDRAILVINRRGTASVVLCRDCGHVQACPGVRAAARLPPGRRRRSAATTAGARRRSRRRCPACGSPRIRYLGGGTERVEREVRRALPGSPGRPARPRRRRAQGRRRAGHRRVRRRPARRPRRDQPRGQGPRHPGGHARRRRVGRCRAQPARRARRRADLPAPGPGRRPGRSRRSAGAGRHPDLPAGPSGDPGGRQRRCRCVLRRRAGAPASGSARRRSAGSSS